MPDQIGNFSVAGSAERPNAQLFEAPFKTRIVVAFAAVKSEVLLDASGLARG